MLELITGLPGSGKTLLIVTALRDNAKQENPRPVFVHGIPDLAPSLLWAPLPNPHTWHTDVPDGAIIAIDEAQHWFPPRPNGARVPDYIRALETHRHKGIDIVLLTQHPKLLDSNIRRLTERHRHTYRIFGMERHTIREWSQCNDEPAPPSGEANVKRTTAAFDKSLYGLYKSATVHTHKARLPWRKLATFGAAITVVIAGGASLMYRHTAHAEPAISNTPTITPIDQTTNKPTNKQTPPTANESLPAPSAPAYTITGRIDIGGAPPVFLLTDTNGNNAKSLDWWNASATKGRLCLYDHPGAEPECIKIPPQFRG